MLQFIVSSIVVILAIPSLTTSLSSEFDDIALKCCLHQEVNVSCCVNSIRFRLPLTCSSDSTKNEEMVACLEEKLIFNQISSVRFLPCCEVYENNQYDTQNTCSNVCKEQFMIPNMNQTIRMTNIEMCMDPNKLFNCFRLCLKYTKRGKKFDYNEKCSWESKFTPNPNGFMHIPPSNYQMNNSNSD